MPLDWLRRLLGAPTQQPDIRVLITPDTVIRPGDTVVLCLPVQPVDLKSAVVEAAKQWAPKGCRVAVFTSEDAFALNLTRALKDVLRTNGGHCACDAGPQPLHPGTGAPCRSSQAISDPTEGAESGLRDVAERVGAVVDSPEPSPGARGPVPHPKGSP